MVGDPLFWIVLGLSPIVYWRLPHRYRHGFLALVSFGYLLTREFGSVCALLVWCIAFFYLVPHVVAGRPHRGRIMAGLILGILGYLAFFKYIPPLMAALATTQLERQWMIPLGISYYAFKLMHYAIEVARGNIEDRSLSQFLSYMFLFTIFSAGPIERYDHYLANQEDEWRSRAMTEGLTRIMHGLIKKFAFGQGILFLFNNPIFPINNENLLELLPELPFFVVWLFLGLTYLYIYCDFSGYTDIALGASRLFGIGISENFNYPLGATNLRDFWRRWHMTLSGWCQTYVYMPVLGLFRRPYLALYAAFFVIGIWHAGTLNRAIWGLYNGLGVATFAAWSRLKRKLGLPQRGKRPSRIMAWGITQAYVCMGAAFVYSGQTTSLRDSFRVICKLFSIDVPA